MREEFEAYNWITGATSSTKFTDRVTAELWLEERRDEFGTRHMRNWGVRAIYMEPANNFMQVTT